MSHITTVSLTDADWVLLDELRRIDRKRFSPTTLLRRALLDARQEVGIESQTTRDKDRKIENMAERLHSMRDFIAKKGFEDEFVQELVK